VVKLIRGPSIEQLVDDLFPADAGRSEGRGVEGAAAPDARRTAARSRTFADGWLVCPRPSPEASARLFCFPFAGGSAATFRTWADALHPTIEVVAIEPPGRATRIHEKPVRSIKAFVDTLMPALRPQLERPSAFFGHCLGGVTAFETARRLAHDHQIQLQRLFVSGARPPHRLAREGSFEENLLAGLLTRDDFDPLLPVYEQSDEVFAAVIRQFNIGATDEFLSRPELRRALLPAVRADFAMASDYRATPDAPLPLSITSFTGLDDPYVSREDAVAWSAYTRTAFRLHLREGAHFMIVDDRDFILDTIMRELRP
jgi:surfactin synthase thioesterase subunit